jgi:hypothetical protein
MDSQFGRVVAWAGGTFTFDVCTNTWQQILTMHSPDPPYVPYRLAYDPVADVVLALAVVPTTASDVVRRPVSGATADTDSFLPEGDPALNAALLGVWAYSVAFEDWAQWPSAWFPAGFEPTELEDVVIDPGTRQVLMLVGSGADEGPKDLSLWAYDEAWHGLTHVGGKMPLTPTSVRPSLSLDLAARQLVLALIDSRTAGQTWTFDLGTRTWTDQQAQPPAIDVGEGTTFDPIAQRTVAFGDNGTLATYRTGDDHWDVVAPGPGWPPHGTMTTFEGGPTLWTGPLARHGQSLVYDPVNQRILMLGGLHVDSPADFWGGLDSGDVWAYDLRINTWIELVHATD